MIYLPIILIPLIFGLIRIIKPKVLGTELCAVCVAVSTTWLILILALFLFIVPVSPLMIGILMGMSVIGGLTKIEPWLKKNTVQYVWLIKLNVILGGLYTIYFLLEQEWQRLIVTIIASLLALVIATFFSQSHSKHQHETKKHLDDCC